MGKPVSGKTVKIPGANLTLGSVVLLLDIYLKAMFTSPIATVPEVHLAQYKSFAINDMRKANSMWTFTRLKCPPLSSLHEKSIY